MEKQCSKCDKIKSILEFHKDKSRKDGYRYICKKCIAIDHSNRYLENKDEILEYAKKYYSKNKTAILKKCRKRFSVWWDKNKDHYNKIRRERARLKREQ